MGRTSREWGKGGVGAAAEPPSFRIVVQTGAMNDAKLVQAAPKTTSDHQADAVVIGLTPTVIGTALAIEEGRV
jgi:hypothetical protein